MEAVLRKAKDDSNVRVGVTKPSAYVDRDRLIISKLM